MTHAPLRRRARLTSSPLLRRFADANDRAGDAADCSDESLARYDRLLAEEAELCAVPADLLRAICWYASGWRQYEPSGRTIATPDVHGTRWGCMQLSDHWHPDAFPAAMSDPRANIRYAANLLHWLHEQTGSWRRATVAFFGHDARAEHAGRRVHHYRSGRPWAMRLAPPTAVPVAAEQTSPGDDPMPVTTGPGDDAGIDDLYADLAL
ncbi:MAG: Soluble lytic murein transglycosylase [Thermoleophilia bacterium]|nr:Soluble lytic murein transglycosylase [Thermoleophilia bacterium]